MARKLPWLSTGTKGSKDQSTAPRTVKRRKVQPEDSDSEDADKNVSDHSTSSLPKSKAVKETSRPPRNPSSSPPPSPPRQDYMRPGLEQDDIWVMVEDEFLSTAHLYTSHLHKAEYLRLKKLARAQNASTIQNISRPVDGRTDQSMESRKKMEGAALRLMGEKVMKNLQGDTQIMGRGESEDEEEEDPWMRDPRLKGLMVRRETSTQLSKIAGVKSRTRASEGYAQASQSQPTRREDKVDEVEDVDITLRGALSRPQARTAAGSVQDEDSDSDDLGGPSQSYSKTPNIPVRKIEQPARAVSTNHTTTTSEKRIDSFNSLKPIPTSDSSRPETGIRYSAPPATRKATSPDTSLGWDDLDALSKRQPFKSRLTGRLRRRKDDAEDEANKRRSIKAEEVPTFLF